MPPLTEKEFNARLYQKMKDEFSHFLIWYTQLEPKIMMAYADELVIKREILLYMEYNQFDKHKAQNLLKSDTPLHDIYQTFIESEIDYFKFLDIGRVLRSFGVNARKEEKHQLSNLDDMIEDVENRKSNNKKEKDSEKDYFSNTKKDKKDKVH